MEIPAYQQVECFHRFENAHRRAQLWRFWRQLTGKPLTLLPFAPIYSCLQQRAGLRLGLREIPMRQIVGSFDKAHLFDRAFWPLPDALRKRWVNMKMLQMAGGWEPIGVHKIGNLYFVEDGHHRCPWPAMPVFRSSRPTWSSTRWPSASTRTPIWKRLSGV